MLQFIEDSNCAQGYDGPLPKQLENLCIDKEIPCGFLRLRRALLGQVRLVSVVVPHNGTHETVQCSPQQILIVIACLFYCPPISLFYQDSELLSVYDKECDIINRYTRSTFLCVCSLSLSL